MDEGTKGVQFIQHLMTELGLVDAEHAITILNDNTGAVNWTKTGGPASKKTRHMNIREFRVAECQQLVINCSRMTQFSGKTGLLYKYAKCRCSCILY